MDTFRFSGLPDLAPRRHIVRMSTPADHLSTPLPPSNLMGNVLMRGDALKIKVIGKRQPPATLAEAFRRAEVLRHQLDLLNPFPRPRRFVFKAKTREPDHWTGHAFRN